MGDDIGGGDFFGLDIWWGVVFLEVLFLGELEFLVGKNFFWWEEFIEGFGCGFEVIELIGDRPEEVDF